MSNIEYSRDLISYIYGELGEEEKALFEQELNENPDLREELKALKATRSCLQGVDEIQEVPPLPEYAPAFVEGKSSSAPQWWQSPWLQAAVFVMALMSSAALTGLNIRWNEEGFSLRFGEAASQVGMTEVSTPDRATLSPTLGEDERDLIRQLLLAQQDSLSQQVETHYSELDNRLQYRLARLANQKQEVSLSEDQFSSIRRELLRENYQLMTDLMEYGADYQRSYNEQMIGEFAQYLDRQRSNDLQLISVALQDILQQNNIQQQETEILLGQLINHIASD